MKKPKLIFACALLVAVATFLTVRAAEEGEKQGKATVRSVHGKVQYQDPSGAWLPVRPNMKFSAGVVIRTGPDGTADLSVNGLTSVVRMTNSTTLQIPKMSYVGTPREGDSQTMLNLASGTVLGNVKKISANSRYEITTPHGVAGIRGTDFMVEAIPTSDGKFLVTFSSITGLITVSAVVNGVTETHTLTSATSWQIGETPRQMAAQIVEQDQAQILALVQATVPGATIGNPVGPGVNPNNNNNLSPDPHQGDTQSGD